MNLNFQTITEEIEEETVKEFAPKIIKKLPEIISTKDGDVTR